MIEVSKCKGNALTSTSAEKKTMTTKKKPGASTTQPGHCSTWKGREFKFKC